MFGMRNKEENVRKESKGECLFVYILYIYIINIKEIYE